jgi:hypothetical protein
MMKYPLTSSFLVQHSAFNIRSQRLSLRLYGSEARIAYRSLAKITGYL